MNISGCTEIPDSIKDKAYLTFVRDKSKDYKDKMIVRQYRYTQEHGEFELDTKIEDNYLVCNLTINNKTYTSYIPLEYDKITEEVYPIGDITFKNVKLLSVSFTRQNSWADEAFSVTYWADIHSEDKDLEPYFTDNIKILSQYYVPRGLKQDDVDLPEIVDCVNNNRKNKFKPIDVHNYAKYKTPNPWTKYSMAVLYEDRELATKLFEHEEAHSGPYDFEHTPPER